MGYRVAALVLPAVLGAAEWTQFRGPNATGVTEETGIPLAFGPEQNVVWKTPVPTGHSSPVLTVDRIYLTGAEGEKLYTFAVDRASGRILWRREAPRPRKQEIERPANGPSSASPVTDGKNVYSFFQDFGLLAYGPDGNELWRMALGPFNNPFGHGSSPILSLRLAMNMACILFHMTVEEAILGVTRHAAKALGRDDIGVLKPGARANLAIWDSPSPASLVYEMGPAPLFARVFGGIIDQGKRAA